MRRKGVALGLVLAGSAALLVPAVGAQGDGPPGTAAACKGTKNISYGDDGSGDNFARPSRVSIRRGQCVRWVFKGKERHNVMGSGVESKTRRAPYSYRKQFNKRRTVRLICDIHPGQMNSRVTVK